MKAPEIYKAFECLDKMQFFIGQRAGRELWLVKQYAVQERDIEDFNRDIETVRDCIQQLEAQMPRWISVKAGLPKAFNDVDIAFGNADSIGFYSNITQRWYRTTDGNGVPVHGVHHWKYRDEPPKED